MNKAFDLFAGLLLGCSSFSVNANLLADGLGVYDDAANLTWTQDANLLGSLENTYGNSVIVNAVMAADPVVYDTANGRDNPVDSGAHTLTANDFSDGGQVDWFAAEAFAVYLNSVAYDGSTQWALPVAAASCTDASCSNSPLGEMFNEQSGSGLISNFQSIGYWTGTEDSAVPNLAWAYMTPFTGSQSHLNKGDLFYAWVVTSGNVTAVPTPGAMWLFGSVLTCFIVARRKNG